MKSLPPEVTEVDRVCLFAETKEPSYQGEVDSIVVSRSSSGSGHWPRFHPG